MRHLFRVENIDQWGSNWPLEAKRIKKWAFFFGPKSWFWAKKFDFCHTTPILVNGPFVALEETVHFPRWERFFYFLFPSYGRFRKKKTWPMRQKVFPLPTVGAPSASNSGLEKEKCMPRIIYSFILKKKASASESRPKFSFRITTKVQP